MLNHPQAGNIMEQLATLAKGNITLHTQVVLCPGINDKEELKRTIQDLGRLWPAIYSLAIVPVGLTRYRQGLYPLRCFNSKEAEEVIGEVEKQQAYFLKRYGYPFVYASDEFYFLAGLPIPAEKYYADYPQTENGVGLTRLFLNEGVKADRKIPKRLDSPRQVTIITGVLGKQVLTPVVDKLNQVENLKVNLAVIPNHFFGEQISVAGLLTAEDIYRSLAGKLNGELVIIPVTALLEKSTVFLDEVTITELEEWLGVPVKVAKGARELVQICCQKDFKWLNR
jgi:putative radical SAM enzyme (TIGR03279 family)